MVRWLDMRWQGGKMINKGGKVVRWLGKIFLSTYPSIHLSICLSIYLSIYVFLIYLSTCICNASVGTTSANFLKIPVAPRAVALGDAFVAVCDDSLSIFFNPAGFSQMNLKEVQAGFSTFIEGVKFGHISFGYPLKKIGGFGFGFVYLTSGDIEERGQTRDLVGTYRLTDIAISFGYGREIIKRFSGGITAKVINEKIKDESDMSFAADIGGLYTHPFSAGKVLLGFSVQNVGPKMGPGIKSAMPAVVKIGGAVKFINESLTLTTQLDIPFDTKIRGGYGIEYILYKLIAFRIGYRLGFGDVRGINGLSGGFGVSYFDKIGFTFDYGIASLGDLGQTHRVSIGFKF